MGGRGRRDPCAALVDRLGFALRLFLWFRGLDCACVLTCGRRTLGRGLGGQDSLGVPSLDRDKAILTTIIP
jgi:hypothetical protein